MSTQITYPDFPTWKWRSYDGRSKIDLKDFIAINKDKQVFIGTDSQHYKKNCVFTTVLIASEFQTQIFPPIF